MKNLRVAYILEQFPAISETFISDEIYSVMKAGVQCHVFSLTRHPSAIVHPRAQNILDSGAVTYYTPRSVLSDLVALLGLAIRHPVQTAKTLAVTLGKKQQRWLARYAIGIASEATKLGITHFHAHYADTAAQLAMWAHRWTGYPFTFTTHGYDIFKQPPANMNELVDEAEGMVTVSHYNMQFIAATFGIDRRKLRVIRCGIYTSEFENDTRVPRMKNEAIRLLCVARLMPEKGHQFLFDALRMLVEKEIPVELALAGEGPLRAELESLSTNLGIRRSIQFLGEQSGLQVRQLFRDCDIAVLASVSESVGLANMEGMASGRPVIATAVRGVPELVEDRITGFLCPPKDPQAIADTILWILANPEETRLIVERGKERVKAEFSREGCTRRLVSSWDRWGDARGQSTEE